MQNIFNDSQMTNEFKTKTKSHDLTTTARTFVQAVQCQVMKKGPKRAPCFSGGFKKKM